MKNNNNRRRALFLTMILLTTCVAAQTQYQKSERPTNQDSTNIFPLAGPSGMSEIRSVQILAPTTYLVPGKLSTAGTCGASANSILTGIPTSLLCDNGKPSAVSYANGAYGWTCTGSNGVTAQCSAVQRVVAVCGSSNGASTSTAPSNLCSAGTATTAVLSGATYNWYCAGNYGSPATCSAALVAPAPANKSVPLTWIVVGVAPTTVGIPGTVSLSYSSTYGGGNAIPLYTTIYPNRYLPWTSVNCGDGDTIGEMYFYDKDGKSLFGMTDRITAAQYSAIASASTICAARGGG